MLNFFKRTSPPEPVPRVDSRPGGTRLSYPGRTRSPGPFAAPPPVDGFIYTGTNRADFYRFMRDRIPIISAGIWTWTHLCSTPQHHELRGSENAVRRAEQLVSRLEERVFPCRDGRGRGLRRLTEGFFFELFTLGRFAVQVQLFPDFSGISHVELLDPYKIRWKRDARGMHQPWLETEPDTFRMLNPNLLFHRTLLTDPARPGGIDPLASIPFVVEIEQRMLEDMARASHNAGTPRLQVRIAPPDPHPGEDAERYTSRINSYFERTVSQFDELGADDNIFTWSDVEVTTIGGGSSDGGSWKINREQVIEDVITGLKLFPWTVGRSHGTTRNWIFAQYNLLMQIVDSVQTLGCELAEYLINLELRLAGSLVDARWQFAPNQDPFIVERNRAKTIQFERLDRMVEHGYISMDQATRELGYDRAHRRNRQPQSGGK